MIGVGLSKRFMRDPNGRYKDGMDVQVYQWSGLPYRSPWEVLGVRRIGVLNEKS